MAQHEACDGEENDWMTVARSLPPPPLPFRTGGSSHDLNCRLAPSLPKLEPVSLSLSTLFTFLPVPLRVLRRGFKSEGRGAVQISFQQFRLKF